MLAVHDIKVVQGDERLFVAMPSRKDENGVFRDIVHPIAASSRKIFEETILEAYEKAAEEEAKETLKLLKQMKKDLDEIKKNMDKNQEKK